MSYRPSDWDSISFLMFWRHFGALFRNSNILHQRWRFALAEDFVSLRLCLCFVELEEMESARRYIVNKVTKQRITSWKEVYTIVSIVVTTASFLEHCGSFVHLASAEGMVYVLLYGLRGSFMHCR